MKLKFNENVGEVYTYSPRGGEEVSVFMTEDINHDAIKSLVTQYNEEYSLNRIKGNLEQDERLTGDEVDYIMEQLELFEESNSNAGDSIVAPWTEEVILNPNPTIITIPKDTLQKGDTVHIEYNSIGEVAIEKKERKTRQPRTVNPVTGNGKKTLTPQEYILVLQEKMDLTKLLSNTIAPEIPEGLTKSGRNLMIEFAADHNKLIFDYLEKIQNL